MKNYNIRRFFLDFSSFSIVEEFLKVRSSIGAGVIGIIFRCKLSIGYVVPLTEKSEYLLSHREDIIIALNSQYRWDIIDTLFKENVDFYSHIESIWIDSMSSISLYWWSPSLSFFNAFNLFMLIFIGISNYQYQAILSDLDLAQYHYQQRANPSYSFDEFMNINEKAFDIFSYLGSYTFESLQLYFLFDKIVFKPHSFDIVFSNKISDFILEQLSNGTLSESFINFLYQLII